MLLGVPWASTGHPCPRGSTTIERLGYDRTAGVHERLRLDETQRLTSPLAPRQHCGAVTPPGLAERAGEGVEDALADVVPGIPILGPGVPKPDDYLAAGHAFSARL